MLVNSTFTIHPGLTNIHSVKYTNAVLYLHADYIADKTATVFMKNFFSVYRNGTIPWD